MSPNTSETISKVKTSLTYAIHLVSMLRINDGNDPRIKTGSKMLIVIWRCLSRSSIAFRVIMKSITMGIASHELSSFVLSLSTNLGKSETEAQVALIYNRSEHVINRRFISNPIRGDYTLLMRCYE